MTATTQTQTIEDFDFSIAEGTNQDYVDIYPRIQWQHGSRQFAKLGDTVSHTGGLFVPADQFPNFSAEGWKEDSFISAKNEEIKGYSTTKGYLAVLRVKSWWAQGEGSKTHMLCCIKGVDGLFTLQVGGISKGQPMNNAFTAHRNQIVAMVNRTKPAGTKGFEPYAVYFVVEPGPHETQSSKSDASKGSEVTKPRLYTPDPLTLDYARTLWVGAENYKAFSQLYRDTESWQTQIPKSQDHSDDAPTHSGPGMSPERIDFLGGLIETKGISKEETDQFCMSATNGATGNLAALTSDEGESVIEMAKGY